MRTPWGDRLRIDCGIVRLVRLLWNLGLGTSMSCEDHKGEVEIGVPRAEIAAWVWACAHFDEKPTREQIVAYRQQLEELQRQLAQQKAEDPERNWRSPWAELRIGPNWRWHLNPHVIYCKFPRERLPHVEANCEAALRWQRAARR
jgi:hypothetical protein